MDTYELFLNENTNDKGVFAISLVSDPAIESDWIALSKNVKMAVVDDEKRILMGAVLIPDKLIPRKDKTGEFNVFFSKDTIRKASEMFFENGFQSETTLEHEIDLKTNTVVESWIKVDDINDKSVKFGIDVPIGTWLISMKIKDNDIYKMAKGSLINGFSIEGKFADMLVKNNREKESKNVTELTNKSYNNMVKENETLLTKIKSLFTENDKVKEKEIEEKEVELKAGEKEVEEKEIVVELEDAPIEQAADKQFVTVDEFNAKIAEIIAMIDGNSVKDEQMTEMKKTNVELQKQLDEKPDAKKIVHSPKPEASKSYVEMTNYEKLKYNRDNR